MHKKKMKWKQIFSAVLSAILFAGSVTGSMPSGVVHAAENAKEDITETEEKNWYVLGRPMTEEEKEEQRQLIESYRSFSGEIPLEETEMLLPETDSNTAISFLGSETSTVQFSEKLPREYSSVEQGYTPPVRNQGTLGNCWAQAATAMVEISMIKNHVIAADEVNLSESHLIYYICRPVADPLGGTTEDYTGPMNDTVYSMFNNGGFISYTTANLLGWMGPVQEEDFYDYDYLLANHQEVTQLEGLNDTQHAYGNRAAIVVENVEISGREEMKKAIMEYGSLGIHYNSDTKYYNFDYAAQYCDEYKAIDHAVVIVGWNDDFPKENFATTPAGDGAWLVRNSWGTGHGINGYFWLSYYDTSATGVRAYRAVAADKYDNNYRYDRTVNDAGYINGVEEGSIEAVNVFEIQNEQEVLKAVQFGIQWNNSKYSIQVYKNPENAKEPDTGEPLLEEPIQGSRNRAGHYTIDLGKNIELKKGDKIAVSVTFTSDNPLVIPAAQIENYTVSKEGRSMYRINGGEWKQCSEQGAEP